MLSLLPDTSTQSYNRYTYAFNNPLKYTDPGGYYILPLENTFNFIELSDYMDNEGISGDRRNTDLVRNNLTGYYFDKTPDGKYYIHGTNIQANSFVDYSDYNFGLDEDSGDDGLTLSETSTMATITSAVIQAKLWLFEYGLKSSSVTGGSITK